jgi:hypothetical protein
VHGGDLNRQSVLMRVTVSMIIDAPPDVVFDRVIDLSRMPELSPEAHRFEWLNGDGPLVGRRFRGWNRVGPLGWWTNGWIVEAGRPHRFVFETSTIYRNRQEHTNRWEYNFEHHDHGTQVTERLQTLRLPIHLKLLGPFLAVRWLQLKLGMAATLRRLRRELEREGAAPSE